MNASVRVNKLKGSIALVGCSGRKLRVDIAPAELLYRGITFMSARDYALNAFDGWFILSAKYGVLHPSKRIGNYDLLLGAQSPAYYSKWSLRVAEAIRAAIEPGSTITFLCSKQYWRGIKPLLSPDYVLEFPLQHLRRGEQVKWLREQTGAASAGGQAVMPDECISRKAMGTERMPNTDDFKKALRRKFKAAEGQGLSTIEVKAGDLHREVGGYYGKGNHRMPACCGAMYAVMSEPDDIILYKTKSGTSSTLTIRYKLPRPRWKL